MNELPNQVVFHIGAHKTATTFIQNWLIENSEILKKIGVSVSIPRDLERTSFQQFCFELSKPKIRTVSTEDAESSLLSCWNRSGRGSTYIVSKENMLGEAGRLYINAKRVIAELSRFTIRSRFSFLFYVRRNDHFIESHTLQQLAHGRLVTVDEVIRTINNRDWISVVNDIEYLFPGKVKVAFYERIEPSSDQYIRDFCISSGIDPEISTGSTIPSFSGQNRSISSSGLNLLLKKWSLVPNEEREAVYDKIREIHHTGLGDRPSLLPDRLRSEILRIHRDANRSLIQRYADSDPQLLAIYCPDDSEADHEIFAPHPAPNPVGTP